MDNYTFPKIHYALDKIDYLCVEYFDQHENFKIYRSEIVELCLKTYDRLVEDLDGFNPMAASGYIKLKLDPTLAPGEGDLPQNSWEDYKHTRVNYITERLQKKEKLRLMFGNKKGLNDFVLAHTQAQIQGEYLVLEILPVPNMGSTDGKVHTCALELITQKQTKHICLEFKNIKAITYITVEADEIQKFELTYDPKLVAINYNYRCNTLNRKVTGGYIQFKLSHPMRDCYFVDGCRHMDIATCEKRLTNTATHDVCCLYYALKNKKETKMVWPGECLVVDKMTPKNQFGCAKKLADGSLVIAFGKTAQATLDKFK